MVYRLRQRWTSSVRGFVIRLNFWRDAPEPSYRIPAQFETELGCLVSGLAEEMPAYLPKLTIAHCQTSIARHGLGTHAHQLTYLAAWKQSRLRTTQNLQISGETYEASISFSRAVLRAKTKISLP